jgi:hypothetical protein
MRILFGILSFGAAALLAFHIVPVTRHVVLPFLRDRGKERLEVRELQLGPFSLSEPQVCVFEGVLALLVLGLIVFGIYAFTARHNAA